MEVAAKELDRKLGALVKRCRLRIETECPLLGHFKRLPARIGKPVSQEEVAEAVGITRQWYGRIESDSKTRISPSVLTRIADSLMMDSDERAALFEMAVPEIRANSFTQHAQDLLSGLGALHRLTQRLWAASSEVEALELVREFAVAEFAADVILTRARTKLHRWDINGTGKRYDSDLFKSAQAAVVERWGNRAIDDLMCVDAMTRPGETWTMSERDARFPELPRKRRIALQVLGWTNVSSAMASIRSQSGFVARLSIVHTSRRTYTDVELERLSTIAELASFALSG